MGDPLKWQSLQCIQPCKARSVPGCTKEGTRSSPRTLGVPPRPPAEGQRGPASPPAGQNRPRNLREGSPHPDNTLKKQHYFVFAVKTWSLCTVSFDAHRRAKIAMLIMLLFTNRIDALTILQCFCFVEQNTIWKWYLLFQLFCSTWKINQYKANQH